METEHRNEQREEAENERQVVNSGSEIIGNTRDVTSNTETKQRDGEKELTGNKQNKTKAFVFLNVF